MFTPWKTIFKSTLRKTPLVHSSLLMPGRSREKKEFELFSQRSPVFKTGRKYYQTMWNRWQDWVSGFATDSGSCVAPSDKRGETLDDIIHACALCIHWKKSGGHLILLVRKKKKKNSFRFEMSLGNYSLFSDFFWKGNTLWRNNEAGN